MRSKPWLDTEHYPLITFDGKEIEPRRRGYTIVVVTRSRAN